MDTDLHVDDDGFVRARPARCYRVLSDVASWPAFWPRTDVVDLGGNHYTLVVGRRPRRLRLEASTGAWRHETGFTATLRGDLAGSWEVWLEPGWGGTVVHHVVAARGIASAPPRFRRWLRAGLWGLKDHLEAPAAAGVAP